MAVNDKIAKQGAKVDLQPSADGMDSVQAPLHNQMDMQQHLQQWIAAIGHAPAGMHSLQVDTQTQSNFAKLVPDGIPVGLLLVVVFLAPRLCVCFSLEDTTLFKFHVREPSYKF